MGEDQQKQRAEGSSERLRAGEVLRQLPLAVVDPPVPNAARLPLTALEPESFERLSAELVYRSMTGGGVEFYGRRGQAQYGLDVVALPFGQRRTVYQVRRYQTMTPAELKSAVEDFAGPPRGADYTGALRRFDPARFVVMTSAPTENDTGVSDMLADLQDAYAGDLELDLWGAETLGRQLRDAPHAVAGVFGDVWARAWCGDYTPIVNEHPAGLGLVEDPIEVLGLDGLRADAAAADVSRDHDRAASLRAALARALDDAGFPNAARTVHQLQAQHLADSGHPEHAADILLSIAVADAVRAEEYRWTGEKQLLDDIAGQLPPAPAASIALLDIITRWYEEGPRLAEAVRHLQTLANADDPHAAALCCQVMELCLIDGLFDDDPPAPLLVQPEQDAADHLAALRDIAAAMSPPDRLVRARIQCALADSSLTRMSTTDRVDEVYARLVADASAGRMLRAGPLVLSRAAYAYSVRGDQTRAVNLWRRAVLSSSEDAAYGDVRAQLRAARRAEIEDARWPSGDLAKTAGLPNDEHLLGLPRYTDLAATLALQRGELVAAYADVRRQIWHARISGHLEEEKIALRLFADLQRGAGNSDTAVQLLIAAGEPELAAKLAADAATMVECRAELGSGLASRRSASVRVIAAQAHFYQDEEIVGVATDLMQVVQALWSSPGAFDPMPALDAVRALSEFGDRLPESLVDPCLEVAEPFLVGGGSGYGRDLTVLLGNLYRAVPHRRDALSEALLRVLAREDPPQEVWAVLDTIFDDATPELAARVTAAALSGSMYAFLVLVAHRALPTTMQHVVRAGAAALLHRPLRGARQEAMVVQANYATTTASCLVALVEAEEHTTVAAANFTAGRLQLLGSTGFSRGPFPGPDEAPAPTGPATAPLDRVSPELGELAGGDPRTLAIAVCKKLVAMVEDNEDLASNRIDSARGAARLIRYVGADDALDLARRLIAVHTDPRFSDGDLEEINAAVLDRFHFNTGARLLPAHALLNAAEMIKVIADEAAIAAVATEGGAVASPGVTDLRHVAQSVIAPAIEMLRADEVATSRFAAASLSRIALAIPDLAQQFAIVLVSHPDDQVRAYGTAILVADLLTLLPALARDTSARVRIAVARRIADLPHEVQEDVRRDRDSRVRRAATAHREAAAD